MAFSKSFSKISRIHLNLLTYVKSIVPHIKAFSSAGIAGMVEEYLLAEGRAVEVEVDFGGGD